MGATDYINTNTLLFLLVFFFVLRLFHLSSLSIPPLSFEYSTFLVRVLRHTVKWFWEVPRREMSMEYVDRLRNTQAPSLLVCRNARHKCMPALHDYLPGAGQME